MKRENRDLKQTLNAAAHGKRYEMYTPIDGSHSLADGSLASKFSHSHQSGRNSKSAKSTKGRRSASIKAKTPIRESGRTLDDHQQQAQSYTPGGNFDPHQRRIDKDSDAKLNKLINEYKVENERTTAKINNLKNRLTQSKNRGSSISPGKQGSYSKSFKGPKGSEFFAMNDRSPQSSAKRDRGYMQQDPYRASGPR